MRFPKLTLAAALAFTALSGCMSETTSTGATANEALITTSSSSSIAALLNGERNSHGLGALRQNARLNAAAMAHARDMASNGFFAHVSSNGDTIMNRVSDAGYRACLASENISYGYRNNAEVMQGWMESPGHRANNLRRGISQFGVAQVGSYVVLVLANPC